MRDGDQLQACPVCSQKDYKTAVLSALPKLTNMDGERNPHTCSYHATLAKADTATELLKLYNPEFRCDPPEQWFTPGMLTVPAVTILSVPVSMSAAIEAARNRLKRMESTLENLINHPEEATIVH